MSKQNKIKKLGFESKQETYIFLGVVGLILILTGIILAPSIKTYLNNNNLDKNKKSDISVITGAAAKEYYNMFQCSCCGRPIDAGCCGMAKQRKDYVDKLLQEGLEKDEILYQMVKKFGFDVLMDPSKEQEIRDYIKRQAPKNPPKIEIDKVKHDFGTVKQTEGVVSAVFTIKNIGGNDLVIENMDTSCMCTSATLIYNGQESPKFGMSMHGENPENFELRIPPDETAKLKVYYDPNAHGKQKKPSAKITREVTIISNDPDEFQKEVRITLIQTP